MKVLIADDESIIRMGLKSMLQELGHSVFAAKNGKDALQQAERYVPDIAILDIRMPYMDGLDVAKSLGNRRPIPIIILTGDANKLLLDKATSVPFQAHLIKPIRSSADILAAMAVATKVFREQQAAVQKQAAAETRLVAQKTIDRARTLLIAQGMDEEAAYHFLQEKARQTGRPMREVAAETIDLHQAYIVFEKKHQLSIDQAAVYLQQLSDEQGVAVRLVAKRVIAIDKAIQIIMGQTGVTAAQADRFISQRAIEAKRPKHVMAAAVIKSARK